MIETIWVIKKITNAMDYPIVQLTQSLTKPVDQKNKGSSTYKVTRF